MFASTPAVVPPIFRVSRRDALDLSFSVKSRPSKARFAFIDNVVRRHLGLAILAGILFDGLCR
jgi:hypothetical protein